MSIAQPVQARKTGGKNDDDDGHLISPEAFIYYLAALDGRLIGPEVSLYDS